MYRPLFRSSLTTILVLISSILIVGQTYRDDPTQRIQGCSTDVYTYPPGTYVYQGNTYTNGVKIPVDRIETGSSRFIFTFSPDKGSYNPGTEHAPKGDKIMFSVFNYGRQTNSFHQTPPPPQKNPGQTEESFRLNREPPLARLTLERRSTLSEEDYGRLNWDETYLNSMTGSGVWYAIYRYAGPLDGPRPDNGTYLCPVPAASLPPDSVEMRVWPNPENYYSYEGSPGRPVQGDGVMNTVKRLSSERELDITGWNEGYYWFTLQSEAEIGGQKSQKTTPPVLIEIRKPQKPVPWLDVKVNATAQECKYVKATATLTLKHLKREDVTLSWEVKDPAGNPVSDYEPSPDGMTVTVSKGLKEGRYTFTATAYGPGGEPKDSDTAYAEYMCRPDPPPGIVALTYFQFEVPYPGEESRLPDPESWTEDRKKPGRNKKRRYPTEHKPGFRTDPVALNNNTKMLDKIVDEMRSNPGWRLYIFGFTDIEKTRKYSNFDLAGRRIRVVLEYLNAKQIGMDRIDSAVIRNCSDRQATKFGTRWSDQRRWDRRVELFYVDPRSGPNPDLAYIDCPKQ